MKQYAKALIVLIAIFFIVIVILAVFITTNKESSPSFPHDCKLVYDYNLKGSWVSKSFHSDDSDSLLIIDDSNFTLSGLNDSKSYSGDWDFNNSTLELTLSFDGGLDEFLLINAQNTSSNTPGGGLAYIDTASNSITFKVGYEENMYTDGTSCMESAYYINLFTYYYYKLI